LRLDEAPSELTKARQAAFRKSEELAEAKRYYEEYTGELDEESRSYYPSWKQLLRDNPIEVGTWLDPQGQARFVQLHFGPEHTECGDPSPDIDALDEVREGEFVATERAAPPDSIIDVDLDGSFEFLYVTSDADYSGWLDFAEGEDRHAMIDADFYCPC
ncbi:MAG: hypothetical protein HC927_04745, partial [Deltaproteobacteria bacterium]|nr:hypothetical protein [Deltaproteobacteria bacterium]